MQILIDLDEIDYKLITEKYPEELSEEYIERLFMKIENGTVLPSPCDVCRFRPPSSTDGKPCCICPAEKGVSSDANSN